MPRKKKQPSQPSTPPKPQPNVCRFTTEGVEYILDWDTFPIHGFVFIRCVETDFVQKTVRNHANRYGVKVMLKVGIRNGYWGVGVWRVQ